MSYNASYMFDLIKNVLYGGLIFFSIRPIIIELFCKKGEEESKE